jgi:hypothetical protein
MVVAEAIVQTLPAYSAPSAPKYSLARRTHHVRPRAARLTKHDVAAIRAWHAEHGAMLTLTEQTRVLAPAYGVTPRALEDVIQNLSFFDPRYDPEAVTTPYAPMLTTGHPLGWWAILFALLAACCATPAPSVPTLASVVREHED